MSANSIGYTIHVPIWMDEFNKLIKLFEHARAKCEKYFLYKHIQEKNREKITQMWNIQRFYMLQMLMDLTEFGALNSNFSFF